MKHPIAWQRWPLWIHSSVVVIGIVALTLGLLHVGWIRWVAMALLVGVLCWMVSVLLCEDPRERE